MMIVSALVHHFLLTIIAISVIINYWTPGSEGEIGKFIFIRDLDSRNINIIPKLIVLFVGIGHILVTLWIISLTSFYAYLWTKKMTAYQYKNKGSIKMNQVIGEKAKLDNEENLDNNEANKESFYRNNGLSNYEDLDSSKLHFLGIGAV
jgi:hypothetical protein